MNIKENVDDILNRVASSAKKAGKNPEDISVISVSKTVV